MTVPDHTDNRQILIYNRMPPPGAASVNNFYIRDTYAQEIFLKLSVIIRWCVGGAWVLLCGFGHFDILSDWQGRHVGLGEC